MRALRVVGVTGDGAVVLEDPGRRERYTVPADEQLRAAARGDVTRLGQIAIELESQLRPREIQARIRGGASVVQVAQAAGVPIEKIERFAYPVLLERSRTAELAQGAHPQRADGPDVRTLGETVAHTFGLRGQDYAEAGWDSWKGEDGKWVVALSWRAGRSDNTAHWAFQPGAHGGTVVALDEHASDLVEGLPARPLRPLGPVIDIARDEELEPAPEPESAHVRAGAESRVASGDPRPARGIAPEQRRASSPPPSTRQRDVEGHPAEPARGAGAHAAPPAPPRPAEQPSPARESSAAERPEQVREAAGDRSRTARDTPAADRSQPAPEAPDAVDAGTPEPASTAAEPAAPAEPAGPDPVVAGTGPERSEQPAAEGANWSTSDRATATESAPETPDTGAEPPAKPASAGSRQAANRRTKKGKPVMPSWDEVLLGVRGQR